MTRSAFTAHRAAASGLFTLFTLIAIALGLGDPRRLALALGGALGALLLLTRPPVRDALGVFAAPLAVVVDLSLLFCAMSLTGGVWSPYALLLPTGVALSWHCEGKAAARFFAAASLFGCAALVTIGGVPVDGAAHLFPIVGVALAAPALLVALEISGAAPASTAALVTEAERETPAPPASAPMRVPRGAAPAAASAPERDREAEILHDLRSPLSVIRVYTDLIQEAARRGELPNPDYLGNLAREIELAERLVGTPAPVAAEPLERLEKPQNADLVEILGSLATAYRLAHGGRIRIEFIAERPQLPVAADPVALQRAFRNVLDNAIKYTPDGGEVRIRAGAAGPQAFVVVKDTGMGMSPEERARAFDYAFRGARAEAAGTRGKGLGLAVTKEILESNGGKISLSSEAGYGSEVTIMLPYQRAGR
ncbi:MAG TPA: HAMP domain-containing sensor histidine kinase [Thermoanaerobaculia bacterium]|nr:HAMP domain-containing sensor histidine kinase [Thermoanaerobaculia bacterium]